MEKELQYKTATRYIHSEFDFEDSKGAVMPPIYQTSTYKQIAPGENNGYEYSRAGNPTRAVLEHTLAIIENGKYGFAFSSGVAAADTVLKLLQPGDEVIAGDDIYGGTYLLFARLYAKFGIVFHYVDMRNAEAIRPFVNKRTKLIWMETPTNPLINIIDIAAVAGIAREAHVWLCVDNTFASPYLQKPLDFGADIVLHSATKYLGGHSDVILGALIVNDIELRDQIYFIQKGCGAIPGPQDCFLVLRGIKTLHVRMDRHCENGEKIALFLRNHPKVGKVYWCGFPDHPGYAVAKKQMKKFGSMLSFELKNETQEEVTRVVTSTKIIALAQSLGGVESLINHPARMTHASVPREKRLASGLKDSLIRLSVGIEDVEDLVEDLRQAIG